MQSHNNSVDEDFINSLSFTLDEIEAQKPTVAQPEVQPTQEKSPTSHKIQKIKDQLQLVNELSESDEINWIKSQLSTRKGEDFVAQIEQVNQELATIRQNQETILREIVQPIDLNEMTNKGQIIHLLEQNEHMREEIRVLTGRIEKLNSQVDSSRNMAHEIRKSHHMLNETKALGDSVESLRNTTYMLNKKIEMMNAHERTQELENKMREIVTYLHQLNTQIQSHFSQKKEPQGDYINHMGFQ